MNDLLTLITGCGGGVFLMSPPAQLRFLQNLRLGCLLTVLEPKTKAELETPQNSGFSFGHHNVGFDWQD